MNIVGSTILITGASQGIGKKLAIHFSARAHEVIIASRDFQKLNVTSEIIRESGGNVTQHILDLTEPQSIESLAKYIRSSRKRVDILINNAANTTSKPLLNTSADEIDEIIRTNVTGCLQLCRHIVPTMIEQGKGMIINISSLAGYNPRGSQTVYSVSKAAVNAVSKALRDELVSKHIHVMNVAQEGLAIDHQDNTNKLSFHRFSKLLEDAIVEEKAELFLSPKSRLLMRLYGFLPEIASVRNMFVRRNSIINQSEQP